MSEAALPVPLAAESIEQITTAVVARLAALMAPTSRPLRRMLTSTEVMGMLGYEDRAAFFAAVRTAKCPMVVINARKIVFDEADIAEWISQLKQSPEAPVSIENGSPAQRRRQRRARA